MSIAAERLSAAELAHLVRRNTALLGASLAVAWSIVQLHSALGAVALAVLLNQPALGGLSPAVFLGSWAAAGWFWANAGDARQAASAAVTR